MLYNSPSSLIVVVVVVVVVCIRYIRPTLALSIHHQTELLQEELTSAESRLLLPQQEEILPIIWF